MKIVIEVTELPTMTTDEFLRRKAEAVTHLIEFAARDAQELIDYHKEVGGYLMHLPQDMRFFPEMQYIGWGWEDLPDKTYQQWEKLLKEFSLRKVLSITAAIPVHCEQIRNQILNNAIG